MNGWNGIEPHIWGGRFNRVRISVLILAAVMVFPVLASDSVRLNARFWDMPMATSGGEPMTRASVPELDDASIREGSGGDLPDPDKPLLGVAISGGGTRSASAAMGQLRALIRLGWFEDVDYLSTVSGGTWASWPFTFLPDAISDQHYLGRYIAPEDLTEADLTDEFPARSLGYAITHAKWRKQALMGWISGRGDETFAYVLGEHFLRNVGLNDRKKLFAFDREQVDHIVTRHRQGCVLPGDEPLSRKCLELGPESFYTTRPGRPFHIANSTVLPNLASQSLLNRMDSLNPSDLFRSIASDSGHEATATSGGEALIALNPAFVYPLEITPIYTGTRSGDTILHGPLGHQGSVGGLLVESYSYDSRALHVPAPNSGPGSSSSSGYVSEYKSTFLGKYRQSRYHFTHSDVLAASGAAPQEVLSALGLRNIGFPEFVHSSRHGAGRLTSREFSHGDGGHADNIGLPALLARGVADVIVFINSHIPFSARQGVVGAGIDSNVMYDDLIQYFLPGNNQLIVDPSAEEVGISGHIPVGLQELYDAYSAKQRKGEPLVHCGTYQVARNKRFAVPGGYTANICWVHLANANQWVSAVVANDQIALPRRHAIGLGDTDDYSHFPHYKTFLEEWEKGELIQYKPTQVHALAHLAGWSVCRAAAEIAQALPTLKSKSHSCDSD